MGPRTKAFEAAVAADRGFAHAVAVSSGTAALHLACAALGLGPGDEVIVPAFTFLATVNAPRYVGATPVLCDVVSPARAATSTPRTCERKLTPRTKAVIAVHMLGYPADLAALRALCDEHGLALVEDAAQGFGVDAPGAATSPACRSSPRSSSPWARAGWCSPTTRRSPRGSACCARTP